MRSTCLTCNQFRCKWGSLCGEFHKIIAMHCYEKEINHPLLGLVRIQVHQKALKENVKKHLSNDEFPLDATELVIENEK